jgi:membrane-associated phospholipid phosphatase
MKRALATWICCALAVLATSRSEAAAEELKLEDLWTDTKLYFTSPLRWDLNEWLVFGGVVGVVAAAHQADNQVRLHFAGPNPVLDGQDKNSIRDIAPAAVALAGTWVVAEMAGSSPGRMEAYTMAEAAAFSTITAEAVKYAAGRKRPNETLDVDDWRAGGSSFPSLHATAAFAVGTVLAESGSDDYRWTRRLLGYGIGAATAFLRLHDNSHWFSDVVAGGAIGVSTGVFALNRRDARMRNLDVSVSPASGGGVALNFRWTPH